MVVGAGLAGLFTALKLAPLPVTVLTSSKLGNGAASAWAQGGIAAAVGKGDTCKAHACDTIKAGAGLVDDVVAQTVAKEAPERIHDLLQIGVPFDQKDDGTFALSREAAHSTKRIVRVSGDRAGAAIMAALVATVRKTPSIRILENTELTDLIVENGAITGINAMTSDGDDNKSHATLATTAVVLATGGVGALYAVTTNPTYARGQALAIAARAGALICDAEFVQFHPTALNIGIDPAPLATESLRGEGAMLVNANAVPFMQRYHKDGDLAPRDCVASAVSQELNAGRGAFLDCRTAIGKHFSKQFPTVFAYCESAGLDPARDLLPVAPAAHYHMGGIATDMRARTNVEGLWAVGEVAATGLHGANRLASNSLLENVVFAARAAEDIKSLVQSQRNLERPQLQATHVRQADAQPQNNNDAFVARLRKLMSKHVGVSRDEKGLQKSIHDLAGMAKDVADNNQLTDLVLAAQLISVAALKRTESRGAHIRLDHPAPQTPTGRHSYLSLKDLANLGSSQPIAKHCENKRHANAFEPAHP